MERSARRARPKPIDHSFDALVARTLREMQGPVLGYSKRVALLKEAARRGIGRFEANLIIALAQHHQRRPIPSAIADRKPNVTGLLTFLIVQSLILWGVW